MARSGGKTGARSRLIRNCPVFVCNRLVLLVGVPSRKSAVSLRITSSLTPRRAAPPHRRSVQSRGTLPPMFSRSSGQTHVMSAVALRQVVNTLVLVALLTQAVLAIPLAVRMATDAMWSVQFGTLLCTDASHGDATDHAPTTPPSSHLHDQCLICHGSAVPFGMLAAAAILLAIQSIGKLVTRIARPARALLRLQAAPYRSRAPPLFA